MMRLPPEWLDARVVGAIEAASGEERAVSSHADALIGDEHSRLSDLSAMPRLRVARNEP